MIDGFTITIVAAVGVMIWHGEFCRRQIRRERSPEAKATGDSAKAKAVFNAMTGKQCPTCFMTMTIVKTSIVPGSLIHLTIVGQDHAAMSEDGKRNVFPALARCPTCTYAEWWMVPQ